MCILRVIGNQISVKMEHGRSSYFTDNEKGRDVQKTAGHEN